MLEVVVLATIALGICTGLGFVVMMFVYFHSGPLRLGDQVMSASMLLGGMCQFVGFCMGMGGSITCDVISIGLFALSNAMFWSARVAHGANRPAAVFGGEVPAMVVRGGPYRFVRHPFYAAYILYFVGLAVAGNWWWQYAIAFVVAILYDQAARQEERLMLASPSVGLSYSEYYHRTWRWLPLVW